MDLLHALGILKRRWLWAVIGLIPAAFLALSTTYHVGLSGLHKKSIEYGSAATEVLVDSPQSTLAFANADVAPLADRAQVFAQFFATMPVIEGTASRIHVNPNAIGVSIPNTNPNQFTTAGQNSAQRNSGLLSESNALQLLIVAQPNLPLITINAQGPTGQAAANLANAAAASISSYIASLKTFNPTAADIARQAQSGQLPSSHVGIRQLGTAQGGMVDAGASKTLAGLAFVGLVILDCILVMMIGGFVEKMKLRRELGPEVANA